MGLCKDCRWWIREPIDADLHPELPQDSGICELTVSSGAAIPKIQPRHPESLAVAEDDERFYAALRTRPHFGCVQFEAKADAD